MVRGTNTYKSDGMSTVLFDKFVNMFNGQVYSVDIDLHAVQLCSQLVSDKTHLTQDDSVKFLYKLSKTDIEIDVIYLDSFDIDWDNPHPSSFHHIKEFLAIMPILNRGTLIVVDDNIHCNECGKFGKGVYIRQFMENIDKQPYFDEYQVGWIW